MIREQDGLPYRSATPKPKVTPEETANEAEYSTLRIVRDQLAETIDGLSKNFNAFDILQKEDVQTAAVDLLRQVEVKQGVHAILVPLLDTINSAMVAVDKKYKK